MTVASLFFDYTPLPMAFGIIISAVIAFVLAQLTLGRSLRYGRRSAGRLKFGGDGHVFSFVLCVVTLS